MTQYDLVIKDGERALELLEHELADVAIAEPDASLAASPFHGPIVAWSVLAPAVGPVAVSARLADVARARAASETDISLSVLKMVH